MPLLKSKMKKKQFTKIFISILIVLGLLGVGVSSFVYQLTQPIATEQDVVAFEVTPGQSLRSVAEALKANDLVRSTTYVRYVANNNDLTAIKAGIFRLDRSWTVLEILETLNDGSKTVPDQVRVTLPEGFWAKDIAKRMSENTNVSAEELLDLWNNEAFVLEMIDRYSFLSAEVINPQVRVYLEGYLFPETYDFYASTTPRAITIRLLDQTQRVYNRNLQLFEQSELSVHDVFIFASIVQYEARELEDMRLIAGVFYNRLRINMPLQASPTVCYSLYEFESWLECERRTSIDSPYNTYVYRGLPVGPILNPSEMAITATLNPQPTDYLYFMADVYGDGTIYFAKTLAEHEANVNKYLRGR